MSVNDRIPPPRPISPVNWRDSARERDGQGGRRQGHEQRRSPFARTLDDIRGHEHEGARDGGAHTDPASDPVADGADPVFREPAVVQPPPGLDRLPGPLLSDRVQAAVQSLMGEMERMKDTVARARDQVADADAMAEGDGVLPVLNRRAFLQTLGRMMREGENLETPVGLICLYLDNFERLRRVHGLSAALSVLEHVSVAALSKGGLAAVTGTLGGASVVVARAGTDSDRTALLQDMERWAETLCASLRTKPVAWRGLGLTPDLVWSADVAAPLETPAAFAARVEERLISGA